MSDLTSIILALLLALGVNVLLASGVGYLAHAQMHRSFWVWALLALIFSPLAGLVFLLVAGPPVEAATLVRQEQQKEIKDIEQEEERVLTKMEEKAEQQCPSCGSAINVISGRGTRSPEREPWRLICRGCGHEIDAGQMI